MNPGLLLFVLAVGTVSAQQLISPPSRACRELGAMNSGVNDGTSVPKYSAGQTITVTAQVPNMKSGAFEFDLCPRADVQDEDCLFKYPLELAEGGGHQFKIESENPGGQYEVSLLLPQGVTCETCTIMVVNHKFRFSSQLTKACVELVDLILTQWTLITKQCAQDSSCSNQRTDLCADISITDENHLLKNTKDKILGQAGQRRSVIIFSISRLEKKNGTMAVLTNNDSDSKVQILEEICCLWRKTMISGIVLLGAHDKRASCRYEIVYKQEDFISLHSLFISGPEHNALEMNPGLLLFVLAVGTVSAQQLISPPSRACRELGAMNSGVNDGTSVPKYSAGQTIRVTAQVPNMKSGAFEFDLCPRADAQDEDCLFKYPLELAEGGGHQFKIESENPGGQYEVSLLLPQGLTCETCTIMVVNHKFRFSSQLNKACVELVDLILTQWTLITKQCAQDPSCSSNQRTDLCADISITEEKTRKTRFWGMIKKILFG
ncbi:putative Lytic polysaccharide mono-oxygenase, cellulose-degrading-containing protein 8 [Homarus americanus]|uniref:Putative Lytic polysaccharide mono-oxygenase, cellulose-degrading-containing protein 8 n=1 Tax=Homarus americanus TaxID=6706 RepID=A0A8J5MVB3_HOMAM|nr:putative Lytic polysaccharide mono-oxygenase, cellulose-degrading-containing protein 8 [Homarus americanus]